MDQSCFIVFSTPNYDKLYKHFFFSLVGIGIDAKHIYHKLDNIQSLPEGFQSDLWYYCIYKKVEHFKNILKEKKKDYKYFFCCDCDIVFVYKNKDKWRNLLNIIDKSKKQIFYMREGNREGINTGFAIIKQCYVEKMIEIYEKVLNIMNHKPRVEMPLGDQTIINDIKNEIDFEYIPYIYVVFGWTIFNKKKSLFHHAIGSSKTKGKLNQLTIIKNKFLM